MRLACSTIASTTSILCLAALQQCKVNRSLFRAQTFYIRAWYSVGSPCLAVSSYVTLLPRSYRPTQRGPCTLSYGGPKSAIRSRRRWWITKTLFTLWEEESNCFKVCCTFWVLTFAYWPFISSLGESVFSRKKCLRLKIKNRQHTTNLFLRLKDLKAVIMLKCQTIVEQSRNFYGKKYFIKTLIFNRIK